MATHPDPGMTSGQRIKLYRQRAGLTQEAAAGLKGCSLGAWRKWEQDERQVTSLADWIEIARILRVRDLYALTGLPVAQLPDEPAEPEIVQPVRMALHAYRPQLDGEPDVPGLAAAVEFAWDTWHSSQERYSRTGPMLPGLIETARASVTALEGPARREAQRVAATMYLLVRAFTKRIGSLDLAMVAADRALVAAGDADDPYSRAAAAWNAAMVLSTRGYPGESSILAREALAELESMDNQDVERIALIGALNLLLSVQSARLREERHALDALDRAQEAAAATGETNFHRLVFGPTNVGQHRATVALDLSRPAEALRIAERIDVTTLPSVERQHSHYLDLARAYSTQRDDVASLHMLLKADRACAEESKLNLIFRAVVRDLLTRETATTRPELRPLAERIGVA